MKIKDLLIDNKFTDKQIKVIKSFRKEEILNTFLTEAQYMVDINNNKIEDILITI